MSNSQSKKLVPLEKASKFTGTIEVPPDKSIAQRSVILAAAAEGETKIKNFPISGDPQSTLSAVRFLGIKYEELNGPRSFKLSGEIEEPVNVLDLGNSGTGLRLLLGLLAGHPTGKYAVLTGDESLRRRPMGRLVKPLRLLGAHIDGRASAERAPLSVRGQALSGGMVQLPVASAQLKSALLLSCLNAEGSLTLREPAPSRNHTELMLKSFGAKIEMIDNLTVKLEPSILKGCEIEIPGDPSSAAFMVAAALLVQGSKLIIKNVCLNPSRTGYIQVLQLMGAKISTKVNPDSKAFEPIGEIEVEASPLNAIEIGGDLVPNVIDEIPILALIASQAKGKTVIKDAEELRVKESDRLKAMFAVLSSLGVKVQETKDGLIIEGQAGAGFKVQNDSFEAGHDHRIAMTVGIASLISDKPLYLYGAEWADVSFPGFFNLLDSSHT